MVGALSFPCAGGSIPSPFPSVEASSFLLPRDDGHVAIDQPYELLPGGPGKRIANSSPRPKVPAGRIGAAGRCSGNRDMERRRVRVVVLGVLPKRLQGRDHSLGEVGLGYGGDKDKGQSIVADHSGAVLRSDGLSGPESRRGTPADEVGGRTFNGGGNAGPWLDEYEDGAPNPLRDPLERL